ncbi:MAG: hypothetical protein MZV65_17815 [Chromatiales bacterium]|nr:hypothetical protein [Chromatiales bacterium]
MMLAGGVPLLFGLLLLAFSQCGELRRRAAGLAFDLPTLLAHPVAARPTQYAVFLLLLLGFARQGAALSAAHLAAGDGDGRAGRDHRAAHRPQARGLWTDPLRRAAGARRRRELRWLLAALGTVCASCTVPWQRWRRPTCAGMLAYASLSHVGLVVLGIGTRSVAGPAGCRAAAARLSSLAAGGLFLLAGFLHHRIGSTDLC